MDKCKHQSKTVRFYTLKDFGEGRLLVFAGFACGELNEDAARGKR